MNVNFRETVNILAGFLQSSRGKLEEAEDIICVFVIYCLFESK